MSDHIKVEESFVEALINNAAWDAARVSLVEKKDDGESKGDKGKDKKDPEAKDYTDGGDRKGDEGAGKKKGDKPDFTTKMRKGDKSKTHPGKKDFEDDDKDEMKEAVEEHVCPLCESTLEEALTDDQIQEHVAQIQAALQSIEEEDEVEEGNGPTDDELDAIEAGDEKAGEVHASRKKKVEAKVKELKASAKK